MQVVTLVLYTYFIAALLGRQMIPRRDDAVPLAKYEDPDLYFPLFTALQVSLNRGRKKNTFFSHSILSPKQIELFEKFKASFYRVDHVPNERPDFH